MSNRKLVSVQEITNIEPIEGADRIEVARILGWRVVVGKDMHLKPGDRVAYFETDSLLPAYDPRYKAFQARGQKTMIVGSMEITGHVLRTMKLRGVYSQGLIMRLDELGFRYTPAVGTDITDKANVLKYEEPLPMGGAQIGRFDAPCSKSDAPRLQTLTDHWDEIKTLKAVPTVKVDGTSTTLSMDERGQVQGPYPTETAEPNDFNVFLPAFGVSETVLPTFCPHPPRPVSICMVASIMRATSIRSPSNRSAYTSSVMLAEACPITLCKALTFAPACTASEANVCRMSCGDGHIDGSQPRRRSASGHHEWFVGLSVAACWRMGRPFGSVNTRSRGFLSVSSGPSASMTMRGMGTMRCSLLFGVPSTFTVDRQARRVSAVVEYANKKHFRRSR